MKLRMKLAPKLALIFMAFALLVVLGLGTPVYYYGRSALLHASVSDLVSGAIEKQAALNVRSSRPACPSPGRREAQRP